MPANTAPIFSKAPNTTWAAVITAANTAKDGTGTVNTAFTADATNGSFVQKLIIRPLGTNVVSVMRIFLNNGLTNVTPANNALIAEIPLPATTNTEVNALSGYEVPLNIPLKAGNKINVVLGTAVAGGYTVTAVGGDY